MIDCSFHAINLDSSFCCDTWGKDYRRIHLDCWGVRCFQGNHPNQMVFSYTYRKSSRALKFYGHSIYDPSSPTLSNYQFFITNYSLMHEITFNIWLTNIKYFFVIKKKQLWKPSFLSFLHLFVKYFSSNIFLMDKTFLNQQKNLTHPFYTCSNISLWFSGFYYWSVSNCIFFNYLKMRCHQLPRPFQRYFLFAFQKAE